MTSAITLTREELFERVWSKPLREVAADLDISDVGLGKACRRSGIPLPSKGYWLQQGKSKPRHVKPRLPAVKAGQRIHFQFHPRAPEARQEDFDERERLRQRLENIGGNMEQLKLAVEKFVNTARRSMRKRVDERGILLGKGERLSPLRTSPSLFERAAEVLRGLLARLHGLGIEIHFAKERTDMVVLVVHGQRYWVWLEEHSQRSERELRAKELAEKALAQKEKRYFYFRDRWLFTPSGRLNIKLTHANFPYAREQWGERGKRKLEDRLDDIVIDIVRIAVNEKKEAELETKRAAEREALVLRERERLQRIEHERLRRSTLLKEVRAWERAARFSRYIDAAEAAPLPTLPQFQTEVSKQRWIGWARTIAAQLNPLENGLAGQVPPLPPLPEHPWNHRFG